MRLIPDSTIANLREVAAELLDARTDAEAREAVRAFLCACQNGGVSVDDQGELVVRG
ncbi:MAG: hypothetical protein KGL26_01130 [Pseudomonadota bacterium]|nr:hypothetical protein [Pseudomonadota bacterium]